VRAPQVGKRYYSRRADLRGKIVSSNLYGQLKKLAEEN
jgi:hypothetical protein